MNPYRTNYNPGTVEAPMRWYQRRLSARVGLLIIAMVALPVQAATPALRINGVTFGPSDTAIYVTTQGAKGDNSNDDSTAINAALTSACGSGGAVYLPAGTYKINSSLTTTSGCNNVDIVGAGSKTVINANAIGGGAIVLNNCTNCSVRNLKIAGTSAEGVFIFTGSQNRLVDLDITGATLSGSVDTGGVMMQNAVDVWIERVYAHGNGGAGAIQGVDFGTYGGSHSNKNITIKNCKATSTAVAENYGLYDTSHSLVEGSYASGAITNNGNAAAGGYGIMFYKTGSAVEFGQNRVIGNHIEATQGTGIYMQAQPNSVVSGNRINNAAISQTNGSLQVGGIGIGTAAASGGTPGVVDGVVVSSNSITSGGQAGISAGGDNNQLTGNVIDNTTGPGIILRDFRRGSVTGNTMENCAGGIYNWLAINSGSGDSVDDVVISGNTIRDTTAASGATNGIYLRGGTRHTITGNTVRSAAGHGIELQSVIFASITANGVYDAGASADNTYDGINIADATSIVVSRNIVSGTRHRLGLNATGTSDSIIFQQNPLSSGHGTFAITGNSSQADQRASSFAAAAPVSGTWVTGDVVFNSAPASGGNVGWVCSSGGSPGTWLQFGVDVNNTLTAPAIVGATLSGTIAGTPTWSSIQSFPIGGSASTAPTALGIYKSSGTVASVTSGETDAFTYTLPASALSVDSQALHCDAAFVHAANANSTTYKIYTFGTQITAQIDSGSGDRDAIHVDMVRLSSTSIEYHVCFQTGAGSLTCSQPTKLTGLTLSGTNIIKTSVTGATTNGDLIADFLRCDWRP